MQFLLQPDFPFEGNVFRIQITDAPEILSPVKRVWTYLRCRRTPFRQLDREPGRRPP